MKKLLQGCHFVSDEVKAALQEALQEASRFPSRSYTKGGRSLPLTKKTTLKVDMLRCCELFRVRFYTPCPPAFGSYYVCLSNDSLE
ncbi:hypothetical protein TNCV_4573011 [Trichonephila clavipes]|nr:hypothetical protein TNCV_4573011 [Trichonephila clavipes]